MMIYVSHKLGEKNLIKEIKLRGINPERLAQMYYCEDWPSD